MKPHCVLLINIRVGAHRAGARPVGAHRAGARPVGAHQAGARLVGVRAGVRRKVAKVVRGSSPEKVVQGRSPEKVVQGPSQEKVVQGPSQERVATGRQARVASWDPPIPQAAGRLLPTITFGVPRQDGATLILPLMSGNHLTALCFTMNGAAAPRAASQVVG